MTIFAEMAKVLLTSILFATTSVLTSLSAQSGVRVYHKVTTTERLLAVSYIYYGRVISVETSHHLGSRGRWSHHLLIGPQIGVSRYEPDDGQTLQTGLEVGLKVGILGERRLSDQWSFVYDIGVSPYYVSEAPFRQFPGFLFEDGANAGVRYHLTHTMSIDLMIAFRHLSNGGIRKPNGGINNLGGGLAFVYQPKRL